MARPRNPSSAGARRPSGGPHARPGGGPDAGTGALLARARAQLARLGEDAAAAHLAGLGYAVLERNLRLGDDEADLVAIAPGGAVAVVEVKARRGPWHPEDRVDAVKRANLLRLAAALSERHPYRGRLFQFDVVAVTVSAAGTEVAHWPHAFDASGSPW
jgi:putative endonuclease